tara:strand:+ start:5517 stop:6059 length:543 start_codon:yes stop_codon:yes gene_type:complete
MKLKQASRVVNINRDAQSERMLSNAVERAQSQGIVTTDTSGNAQNYQDATETPRVTIVTKQFSGDFTIDQIAAGIYNRVVLVRYNGVIKEVAANEYNDYKSSLAKGVYIPIEFTWALKSQADKTALEYNLAQAQYAISILDEPLQPNLRAWFVGQVQGIAGTDTRRLSVNVNDYISPLND